MKKKGWIVQWVLAFALLGIIILALISNKPEEINEVCKNQCEIRNLSYYDYSGGGFANYNCNCQNETTGEIKTIYTR